MYTELNNKLKYCDLAPLINKQLLYLSRWHTCTCFIKEERNKFKFLEDNLTQYHMHVQLTSSLSAPHASVPDPQLK